MKKLFASAALAAAVLFIPTVASAQVTAPVTGIFNGGTFTGNFAIDEFVYQGGVIRAVGTLTGNLVDASGNVVGAVAEPLAAPMVNANGTCDILFLQLGPLDLDLLGLVVNLDIVTLNIDAQSGPGKLLGNLLCAVTNLLNSNASGNAITNMLNRIIGQL